MQVNRVVVTGMGVISPLGLSTQETWQGLMEGRSGVAEITHFDTSGFVTKFAAQVKGFDPTDYMDRKEARRMDRFCQFAVAAALQAIEGAGLKIGPENGNQIGVIIGSGIGGISTLLEQHHVLLEKGVDRVSPFLATMMIPDIAAGQISIMLGAKGPNFCTVSSCSSGADAIGTACETIRRGDAVAMLAGGSEATINSLAFSAFQAARALSTRNEAPQQACRPFDLERDGLVMGEGTAVLVLEEMEGARRRGATILGEIIGYGATSDAFHVTQPAEGGEGGARAMKKALDTANVTPQDIDYINAHGTSTPLNDRNETMAIRTVFGQHAYHVPASSTKSMTGHLLGAAGAVEAAISLLTIKNSIIPPTINLTNPDPECDLDYVPNQARPKEVRTVMSSSFGFGGHNSVLVLRRWEDAA
ncbi:MAG: beta-ketoacyl-ACP synthase II [Dehalococcoidia bacterium]|nr:beta-ketoacyl-ACP synthase II [Dehalococcoidia bacterium]